MSRAEEQAIDQILMLDTEEPEQRAARNRDRMLANVITQEMRMAQGTDTSKLSDQRAEAMKRYYGEPYGNEVKGKSDIRTRELMDTVEWIKPELMKIFSSSGDTVRFEPTGPEDVERAKMETAYCNYVYHRKNRGFNVTYAWITDGLLQKNGIVKGYWDDTEKVEIEEYEGISENEMLQLIAPDNVEISEITQYDDPVAVTQRNLFAGKLQKQLEAAQKALQKQLNDLRAQGERAVQMNPMLRKQLDQAMQQAQIQGGQRIQQMMAQLEGMQTQELPQVYDITIQVSEQGKGICIVNVPPEEFFIDSDATCIEDARFCAHEREMTSSELVEVGYTRERVAALPSSGSESYIDTEKRARHSIDDTDQELGNAFHSGANKKHRVKEAYIRYDYDDDGVSELRKVLMVGKEILENERVSCMPFCSWSPIMISHKFYGLSLADIVMDLQRIKTQLFRNILDNQYLANNGRYEVVENMVNYRDLLESKTHGMVRTKAPGMVKRLDTPQLSNTAFQMLQYVDYMRERRTGVSERTQGLDENALGSNTAAAAVNQVMTAAQQRIELIARVFAETGMTQIFHLIHRLSVQHSTREERFRIGDEFVDANPRSWRHRTDSTVVVGLGNGSRESEMMSMNLVFQNQMMLGQSDNPAMKMLVQPENVYQLLEDQVAVMNKANRGRYFTDPGSDAAATIKTLQGQIQQLGQQLQQMQIQMQTGPQAEALQIEKYRATKKAQVDDREVMVKERAQDLKEEAHEDQVALDTAELGLEREQNRGVNIG